MKKQKQELTKIIEIKDENNNIVNDFIDISLESEPTKYNNIPPFNWSRNEYGLLNHINYIFHEDGSVNWRAMIPLEYLVPNKQNFERRKQPVPKSIEGLEDRDLLLLLGGIKFLSAIYGFNKVDHEVIESREDFVCVKTTICTPPNYENNFQSVCFSELADAHYNNTGGFGKYYLSAIAANRGFQRCWRNILRLPVTAADEIGEIPKEEDHADSQNLSPVGPHAILAKKIEEKNTSFEKVKEGSVKKGFVDAEKWNSILDIPKSDVLKILEGIRLKDQESLPTKK